MKLKQGKKMKKYLATATLLVLASSLLMTGCGDAKGDAQGNTQGDAKGNNYAWVFVETTSNADEVAYERTDKVAGTYPHAWEIKIEASENELIHSRTYLGTNYGDVSILPHHVVGNHITRKVTWSKPPAILGSDEEVAIKVKIETIDQGSGAAIPLNMNATAGTRHFEGDNPTASTFFVDKNDTEGVESSKENAYAPTDTSLYGKMGKGDKEGELRAVWVGSYLGGKPYTNLYVMHIYKWQKQ